MPITKEEEDFLGKFQLILVDDPNIKSLQTNTSNFDQMLDALDKAFDNIEINAEKVYQHLLNKHTKYSKFDEKDVEKLLIEFNKDQTTNLGKYASNMVGFWYKNVESINNTKFVDTSFKKINKL